MSGSGMVSMRYGKPRHSGLRYNFEKFAPLAGFRGYMRLTFSKRFSPSMLWPLKYDK